LAASAAIYSAFIASGKYQGGSEKELSEKADSLAISLAERIDDTVSADDEIP
jgi:hypothetical protein